MTREVANLIRENSELLQTKHAMNVLKDDSASRSIHQRNGHTKRGNRFIADS